MSRIRSRGRHFRPLAAVRRRAEASGILELSLSRPLHLAGSDQASACPGRCTWLGATRPQPVQAAAPGWERPGLSLSRPLHLAGSDQASACPGRCTWLGATRPQPVQAAARCARFCMLSAGSGLLGKLAAHRRGISARGCGQAWAAAQHGAPPGVAGSKAGPGGSPVSTAAAVRLRGVQGAAAGVWRGCFAASARRLRRGSTLPVLAQHERSESILPPPCLCWFTAALC